MTNCVEDAINALPPFLGLGSFVPPRRTFDYGTFDADKVRRVEDLPPYLIFLPFRLKQGELLRS
jgi:hypothetical protein